MAKTPQVAVRIGSAIRAQRKRLGITQEDLASQTGIARSNLSAIENGNLGQARILMEVTSALGLDILAVPRNDLRGGQIRMEQDDAINGKIHGPKA